MSGSFQPWLDRWGLEPDGEPFETPYTRSRLLPVRRAGVPAMLKIAVAAEEIRGAALMEWWNGVGAAKVLARDGEALLLEHAMGSRSLLAMAETGNDDEASRIICRATRALHTAPDRESPADLVPLDAWFAALKARSGDGGTFTLAWRVAAELLAQPQDVAVLHGDMHHYNVLDFGLRGWLAIDPKGLVGERGYDFANIARNPNAEMIAIPERLPRQIAVIAQAADLEPRRLLCWTLAHAALSAAWCAEEGQGAWVAVNLAFVERAAAELDL